MPSGKKKELGNDAVQEDNVIVALAKYRGSTISVMAAEIIALIRKLR